MNPTPFIWKNGEFIAWEAATTHVLTHALHYATAVFEGVRAYQTAQGPAIFRAQEHYERLQNSAKIYLMKPPYSIDQLIEANRQLIQKNNLQSCYIRPMYYYGYGKMGLNPGTNPIDTIIAAWEWGAYLGEEGLQKGVRCKVSSWNRIDGRVLPALAKSSANYANSALAKLEALQCGYDEAILLNINGSVSEGPGQNIFMVKNNQLFTPPASDNALLGITAQTIATLAKDKGYEVHFKSISRDELYTADELFFTGSASEVTPIREVDGRQIGNGARGHITQELQELYFAVVHGENANYLHWLTF